MVRIHKSGVRAVAWLAAVACLAACNVPSDVDLPVSSEQPFDLTALAPTDLPPQPKTLIVCVGDEPESLYLYSPLRLYGDASRETDTVLQAIYDGPFDLLGYEPQATILEKAPHLDDGDARLEAISVREGDVYLNPETLQPDELGYGKRYLPSGCSDLGCGQEYQGGQVQMDRMVVDFHLLPNVRWSDGQSLTAGDSVFSFSLDADAATPTSKYLVNRTFSYETVDDRTVRWTGIAGFLDPEYATNFWSPLPRHVLGAIPVAELAENESASLRPLGWGPFVLESWQPGMEIILHRNPEYFRAAEGLPPIEFLIYRFVGGQTNAGVQQLLTGECDVLDETALSDADLPELVEQANAGRIRLLSTPGPLVERIEFDLAPVAAAFNPVALADTRRALAACLDRQAMLDEVLFGLGAISNTYLPPSHPLAAADIAGVTYDTMAAEALLDQVGWVDDDGDPNTPRLAQGVSSVPGGTPLSLSYLAEDDPFHRAIAERLQSDWAACGVDLQVELRPAAELLAPWPDGPIFGRTFQTAGWSWLGLGSPACEVFASWEVASDDNPYGSNASGFRNREYDQACAASLLGLPGSESAAAAARETQEIIAEEIVAMPLLARPRLVATSPQVCGVSVDVSSPSQLWNPESWDLGEACAPAP